MDVEAEQQTVKCITSSESTISSKNNGNPSDIKNAADRGSQQARVIQRQRVPISPPT